MNTLQTEKQYSNLVGSIPFTVLDFYMQKICHIGQHFEMQSSLTCTLLPSFKAQDTFCAEESLGAWCISSNRPAVTSPGVGQLFKFPCDSENLNVLHEPFRGAPPKTPTCWFCCYPGPAETGGVERGIQHLAVNSTRLNTWLTKPQGL